MDGWDIAIDGVGLVPIVGILGKADEVLVLFKRSDTLFELAHVNRLTELLELDGVLYLKKGFQTISTAGSGISLFGQDLYKKLLNTCNRYTPFKTGYSNPVLAGLQNCSDDVKYLEEVSPGTLEEIISEVGNQTGKTAEDVKEMTEEAVEQAVRKVEVPTVTIIKEGATYIDYLNNAGTVVRIAKQPSKTIESAIAAKLKSANPGDVADAKVADFIKNDLGIELTNFSSDVKTPQKQTLGDIDCATNELWIEVKCSVKDVDEQQFIKYTDINSNKYINVTHKKVILYIDVEMKNLNFYEAETLKEIEKMGVKIVNGLEELKGVVK